MDAIKEWAVALAAILGYFLAFFCLLTVATVFHEAGHVLALAACGEEAVGVFIGAGDVLFAFRIGDMIVVVGDLPFLGGATYFTNEAFRSMSLAAQVFVGVFGVIAAALPLIFLGWLFGKKGAAGRVLKASHYPIGFPLRHAVTWNIWLSRKPKAKKPEEGSELGLFEMALLIVAFLNGANLVLVWMSGSDGAETYRLLVGHGTLPLVLHIIAGTLIVVFFLRVLWRVRKYLILRKSQKGS